MVVCAVHVVTVLKQPFYRYFLLQLGFFTARAMLRVWDISLFRKFTIRQYGKLLCLIFIFFCSFTEKCRDASARVASFIL
jgi:hypothetical protein